MKTKSLNIVVSILCLIAIIAGIILSPTTALAVAKDTPVIADETPTPSLLTEMIVENAVEVDLTQAGNFFAKLNPTQPFIMVNLLKFKEKADYGDRETTLTGAQAYQKYLDEVQGLLEKYDVQIPNDLNTVGLLLGKVNEDELWDRVLLVRYPSLATFQKITQEPVFQKARVHRTAGLAGQLNIGTTANK